MKRSEERELAFIILFEYSFSGEDIDSIIENGDEGRQIKKNSFGYELAKLAISHIDFCDTYIEKFSTKWKINRLPKTTLAILRLSMTEIAYKDDIPESVSANEAIELAKKYSGEEDAAYINGILGSFIKSLDTITL